MKSKRHVKILEIIKEKNIETQEELAEELKRAGFEVTQATVSRDIKDLKLVKMQSDAGKSSYSAPKNEEVHLSTKLTKVLSTLIVSAENVGNMVVVKTVASGAGPVAEVIDGFKFSEIAGTIAGDNTVFIMVRTIEAAEELVDKIEEYISY